jgi:hypothetical protein
MYIRMAKSNKRGEERAGKKEEFLDIYNILEQSVGCSLDGGWMCGREEHFRK